MADERKVGKISIDEVVEAAAAGVLRALDARQSAAVNSAALKLDTHELVRSGFFVDFVIRAGGFPTPIDIQTGKLGGR